MADLSAKPLWRWMAVALAAAAAVWLAYAAAIHEWAFHDGASDSPEKWQKAAEIEPGNADNWYRLGRYRHLDFQHEDLPLAIAYYQHAVQLDPLSPFYKLDLAGALELDNRDAEADRYYRAAQQEYPISAEVSWRYGNFLLRQERLREAYAEMYRAIAVDPQLTTSVVSLVWRANPDIDAIMGQVLRNTPELESQALAFFIRAQNGPAAAKVWSCLAAQHAATDLKQAYPVIDLLIQQALYDDAGEIWRQALAGAGIAARPSDGTLVFDGGFEQELSGGGFGWRQEDVTGADFEFDNSQRHSGTRSGRVTFDGSQNLSYEGLYQEILVKPGTHYHFSGFMRTEQISTDSGTRFEIRDLGHPPALDVLTTNETGTQPWKMEEADFTTGPATRVIAVALRRLPSERFDNKIGGSVWIDDVAITPAGNSR